MKTEQDKTLEALQIAIRMEINDKECYYQTLAVEEREYHQILLDYYEYLKDPAGWFVEKGILPWMVVKFKIPDVIIN